MSATSLLYPLLFSLLLTLLLAGPSLARHARGRCRESSCANVTCSLGQVCEVRTGRARCIQASSCDQVRCPLGLRCEVLSNRSAVCQISCDNVACPLIHQCQLRERRGQALLAQCAPPNTCPASCPFNATCQVSGRGTRATAECSRSNSTCADISCPAGSECVERRTRTRPRMRTRGRGRGRTGRSHRSRTDQMEATCSPVCTTSTCPSGLVCDTTGRESKRRVFCRPPRNCEEARCPSGTECRSTSCSRGRGRTPRPPRTGTRTNGTRTRPGRGPRRTHSRSRINTRNRSSFNCVPVGVATPAVVTSTTAPTEAATTMTTATTATTMTTGTTATTMTTGTTMTTSEAPSNSTITDEDA